MAQPGVKGSSRVICEPSTSRQSYWKSHGVSRRKDRKSNCRRQKDFLLRPLSDKNNLPI